MRDTLLLRARLHAVLLSGPLALGGLACGGSSNATPKAAAGPQRKVAVAPTPGRVAVPKHKGDDDDMARPFAKSPYPDRWGFDPYDPEAAEEEGCENGDWCGPVDLARKFANSGAGDSEEFGCPERLVHVAKNGTKKTDKALKGLSMDPMMQGRLRRLTTREARAEGSADACCYHWFNYCSGRPLLASGPQAGVDPDPLAGLLSEDAQVAPLVPCDEWSGVADEPLSLDPELDPELAQYLAAAWLTDAQMEHASVASFARATLELLALGAPPSLVAGTQQAGLDEVAHAQTCFTHARRYGAEGWGPGPLPAVSPRKLDLVGLAVATFVEGCVGETIAALMVTRAARNCEDATIRAGLSQIAADETRHAELAWATVAWACAEAARGGQGPAIRQALQAAAASLRAAAAQVDDDGPQRFDAATLAAHGRLDSRSLASVRDDAWREIVAPTLTMLLA